MLVDVNCWGCRPQVSGIPWACLSPYTPPLRSPGVPPFELGLRPLSGGLGRVRDAAVRIAVMGAVERMMLSPINAIRADLKLRPVASIDEFLRRLAADDGGKPFQYPQTEWGDAVQMIRAMRARPRATDEHRMAGVNRPADRPRVTTSSEEQAGLPPRDDRVGGVGRVHVVATVPARAARRRDDAAPRDNAPVRPADRYSIVPCAR